MRFSRMRSFRITDCLIFVVFLFQGYTSTPNELGLKVVRTPYFDVGKKVELPVNFDDAEHSQETSEDQEETHFVTKRALSDRVLFQPQKVIGSDDAGHAVENDGMISEYNRDLGYGQSDTELSKGQAESLTHEPASKEAPNSQKSRSKTTAQAIRGWFSAKLKEAKNRANNENSGKKRFNFWPSVKSQTPPPTLKEDKPFAVDADGDSKNGWLSKYWSPKSQPQPSLVKEDTPPGKATDNDSGGGGLSPKSQTPPLPVEEAQTAPKRSDDHSGAGWLSKWLPQAKAPVQSTKKDQTEAKGSSENIGSGWFSTWSPQSPALSPPAKENKSVAKRAADSSGGRWFSMWSPSKPPSPTEEQNLTEKLVNDDSGGNALSSKSLPLLPSATVEDPIAKRADNSGGGWLGNLWTPPSPPTPPPVPEMPETSSGSGGWFSGSPAAVAAAEGKKEKKPHGRVREFVKSVEHIVPKHIRRSIKSLPGVRPSRKVMKSTLDVVDRAVDSVVDTDYVKNIKEAGKKSSKRVGVKAVNLADSVLELGTGTSEATLNMAATLQKEGARTLDSVGTALPPTKPAVDYVNTKMANGVASLQDHNDRIRKGGKSVLTSLSDYANLKEVADGKEIVTPAEEKKPDSNSWFGW